MNLNAAAIVGLAIALYVLSAIVPGAIDNVEVVNTSGWSSGAGALWDVIGIVVIAAILLVLVRRSEMSSGGGGI